MYSHHIPADSPEICPETSADMSSVTLLLVGLSTAFIWLCFRRLFLVLVSHRSLLRYPSLNRLCPFTNLAYIAQNALLSDLTRTEYLHTQHRKHTVIRLGPNRLSFASPHAIRDIYGTKSVCSKGDQYSTPGGTPNLLSVVDRSWHAVKRKRMSAAFATSHLIDWQDKVVDKLDKLVCVMDTQCARNSAKLDLRYWSHLFTLDTILDIALSCQSGFLDQSRDIIEAETAEGRRDAVSLRECLFAVNRSVGPIIWSETAYPYLRRFCGLYGPARRQQKLASRWKDIARFLARGRVERYRQSEKLDDLFQCLLQDKAGHWLSLSEDELVAETAHLGKSLSAIEKNTVLGNFR